MDEAFYDKLKLLVKEATDDSVSHDFYHVHRVYNIAVRIAKTEQADLDIVKASVLLHDIARGKEFEKKINCHAVEGAKMAEDILNKMNFTKEKIYPKTPIPTIRSINATINPNIAGVSHCPVNTKFGANAS